MFNKGLLDIIFFCYFLFFSAFKAQGLELCHGDQRTGKRHQALSSSLFFSHPQLYAISEI